MNKKYKKWVTFFSQTGSEIVEISKYLNRWPDVIITNKELHEEPFTNKDLLTLDIPMYILPKKPDIDSYMTALHDAGADVEDTIITLNGYLRVIPAEVCDKYTIYNGHPGDIVMYPELKGFNPQERAFLQRDTMQTAGSVIHRVTKDIDEGEIVGRKVCDFDVETIDEAYSLLHKNSVQLWVEFLENLI